MKILFLSPYVNAECQFKKALESKKVALLFAADHLELMQLLKLHGSSIDLAVVHKEIQETGEQDIGLRVVADLKKDPRALDLPVILTTDQWSLEECAKHQQSPDGVNAYLRAPFTDEALESLIQAVLGTSNDAFSQNAFIETPSLLKTESATAALETTHERILRDVTQVFMRPEDPAGTASGAALGTITLEAPEIVVREALTLPTATGVEVSLPTATAQLSEPAREIELSIDQNTAEQSVALSTALATEPSAVSREPNSIAVDSGVQDIVSNEVQKEMPYLFGGMTDLKTAARATDSVSLPFMEPLGDAVVPGGAAQSPDSETLKKYLLLREQDVAVLSNQLKLSNTKAQHLDQALRDEKNRSADQEHRLQEQDKKINEFEKEKKSILDAMQIEKEELHFQVRVKTDQVRALEQHIKEAAGDMDGLKDRVRTDIRKIRVREKELENRLEIVKKDSEVLIGAREEKIIELKRRVDLLEFNMDLLQDQYNREKEHSAQLFEKLAKVAQVVRVAGGLLDTSSADRMSGDLESHGRQSAVAKQ